MNANLQEEWNNVVFKPGRNAESVYDLAVVEFGSRQSLSELVSARAGAKAALAEELKKLKKDDAKEDGAQEPKVIRIPYEGKGGLIALVLMGDPGAYFLQDALRKAFCPVLTVEEEAREINVSLRGLKDSGAKTFLNWISAMAVITRFRSEVFGKRAGEQKKLGAVTIHYQTGLNKKIAEDEIQQGRILGICNNQVKHLADLPSNVLNPRTYRDRVQALSKQLSKNAAVEFEFIDKKGLQKRGAGCFLAVVQGDHDERAGIVHLRYKGKKAKQKVALVGKGLCFDTGGYNVKVGDFMYNMHRDMTGSAVALSLFRALVEMEAPYEVHCYMALAENLIAHDAFRPNDVVIASNGMSVEVVDTDAEGRMVLSDTLVMASEEKPDLIIDFATLTGAVVRALDTRRCGAFSNSDKLARAALDAGDRCGERVWTFPIGGDYNEQLKSEIADVRQAASGNYSDHIYAATFLSKFVGKGIPWVHIDLAADTNKGGLGLVPTETTGFGVRFGVELIQSFLK